jgi:putative ATP-dependent endonuclease of OLD family
MSGPTVKLKTLILKNFRGYGSDTRIPLADFTAFVGRNDVGKSSILEALDIFLDGGTITLDRTDLCKDADGAEVRIGCVFTVMPTEIVLDQTATTTLAGEHLLNAEGDLEIVKTWACGVSKPSPKVLVRALHPSAPPFNGLLFAKNDGLKKLIKERGLTEKCDLTSNPSMRAALWASAEHLDMALIDLALDDKEGKALWEQIKTLLPEYALFQSDRASTVKDAEVQTPMKLAVKRAMADVKDQLDLIAAQVQTRALEIAAETVATLNASFPDVAKGIQPRLTKEPDWSKVFDLSLDDDRGISLDKRGSGVRRLILLSFFMAEIDRRRRESAEGITRRPMIYAIEEPETSQHPQNQLLILHALQELATLGDQVLITTHTPALAGHVSTASLRFVTRDAADRPCVRYDDDATLEAIADELGVVPAQLPGAAGSLRVALVLEGANDEDALIAMSNILRSSGYTRLDLREPCPGVFTVIGGGSNLQHWIDRRHLDKLDVPQVHIYDSDITLEVPAGKPETIAMAEAVSRSPNAKAFITRRRCMDNYLDAACVKRELGLDLAFGEAGPMFDDMTQVIAEQVLTPVKESQTLRLDMIGRNGKPLQLRRGAAKEWISRYFIPRMSAEEILAVGAYSDTATGQEGNEILEWLGAVEQHVSSPSRVVAGTGQLSISELVADERLVDERSTLSE